MPVDALFGAEGGFVYVAVRGCGAYSAKAYFLDAECVGGAEYGADVVLAADVVEYDSDGCFFCLAEFFEGETTDLVCGEFFHGELRVEN